MHLLFGSMSITTGVTALAGLLANVVRPGSSVGTVEFASGHTPIHMGIDWPVFGITSLPWPIDHIVAIGALFMIIATAGTFALIGSIQANVELTNVDLWKWRFDQVHAGQVGCTMCAASMYFGLITILSYVAGNLLFLRTVLLGLSVLTLALGVVLVTFCEDWAPKGGLKTNLVALRRTLASSIAMLALIFVASLNIVIYTGATELWSWPRSQPTQSYSWTSLALSQYCLICLLSLWPLTYAADAYEAPKAPVGKKLAQWPKHLAGIRV